MYIHIIFRLVKPLFEALQASGCLPPGSRYHLGVSRSRLRHCPRTATFSANPQPNPQFDTSCMTCAAFGSPACLVSCCKTYSRSTVTQKVCRHPSEWLAILHANWQAAFSVEHPTARLASNPEGTETAGFRERDQAGREPCVPSFQKYVLAESHINTGRRNQVLDGPCRRKYVGSVRQDPARHAIPQRSGGKSRFGF